MAQVLRQAGQRPVAVGQAMQARVVMGRAGLVAREAGRAGLVAREAAARGMTGPVAVGRGVPAGRGAVAVEGRADEATYGFRSTSARPHRGAPA